MSIPPQVNLFEELSMGVEGLGRVSGRLITLFGVLPFLGTIVSADEPQRPNVIVFVADDLAWDDLGCYGHPTIRTPSIDRLAERGMRYDAAFLTCSSCSPSRSSMLTGRYPNSTGAAELHQPLPADQFLVATPLRDAGYFTAVAGKWHLGSHVRDRFDEIRDGGGPGGEAHWVSLLAERPRDKPFFLWLAAFDPHRDYTSGAFDPPHLPDEMRVPPILPDTPVARADLAAYADEVARFDHHIGRVLEELERQGETERTLIFVISDNGRPFPACKTRLTTNGIRTPLIACWPNRIAAGSTCDSIVSSVDLAATIVDAVGLPEESTFQGNSFVPTFDDPSAIPRRFAFAEHDWHDYRAFERAVIGSEGLLIVNSLPELPATPPADAVRSPTYVEMLQLHERGELDEIVADVFRVPRSPEELYLWRDDPYCTKNAVERAELSPLRDELREALEGWRRETEDRFPGAEQLSPDKYDRRTGRLPDKP